MIVWGIRSFVSRGLLYEVASAAADSERALDAIARAVASAGPYGPVVYVLAVVVEVMVAPIPGTLLYAPGGAIFGGWWGGTLSLAGNVIGASLAAWIGARFSERLATLRDRADVRAIMERVRRRGLAVVVLLRINPVTSSDLVSYAAGLVGVPVSRVALGTLVGMAPLCYAQAHASEWLFRMLPGAGLVLIVFGVAYVALIVWVVVRRPRRE